MSLQVQRAPKMRKAHSKKAAAAAALLGEGQEEKDEQEENEDGNEAPPAKKQKSAAGAAAAGVPRGSIERHNKRSPQRFQKKEPARQAAAGNDGLADVRLRRTGGRCLAAALPMENPYCSSKANT